MSRRHRFDPADPESVAQRLHELVTAGSGEDAFSEVLKLLVARLAHGPWPWLLAVRGPESIDALLADAAVRWPGVLDDRKTRLSRDVVKRCVEVLDPVNLGDGAVLDAVFEHLTSRVAKGEKGQFFTPRAIVKDAVRRVAPKPGEVVVDPACGSGAFLFHAWAPGIDVRGTDLDMRAVRTARVLLAAAGASCSAVSHAGGLAGPEGFADVVLTNPPFAGDVGDVEGFDLARPGRRVERDVLFLERCVRLLKPGGRLAIVLPHNKVGAKSFGFVRQWLLEHLRPTEVVALPHDAFLPHTSQRTVLLVGVREPATPDSVIRFEVDGAVAERAVKDLVDGDVLAPERYDPRRSVAGGVRLADLVDLVGESVAAIESPTVVLDTTHVAEGIVSPPPPVSELGSQKRQARPGDVLVSRLRPYLRQVGWVDPDVGAVLCSTEFYVLRSKHARSVAFLVPFLLSSRVQQALAAAQEGGHHPRVPRDALLELTVPDDVVAQRDALSASTEAAIGTVRAGTLALRRLVT